VDLFRNSFWSTSNLHCQDVSSSVHTNQQQQFHPLTNTIHESAMAAGSGRNLKALPISLSPQKQQEADGTPPEGFFFFSSLYEVMTHDDQQRMVRRTNTTQHCPLSVELYLYPFQIACPFSRLLPEKQYISVLIKTSSHVCASAKTSFGKLVSRKT
jgi:hypothetical protein